MPIGIPGEEHALQHVLALQHQQEKAGLLCFHSYDANERQVSANKHLQKYVPDTYY